MAVGAGKGFWPLYSRLKAFVTQSRGCERYL
jgi:hypothetical protein